MLQGLEIKCAADARRLTKYAIGQQSRKGIMKDIEETCLEFKSNGIYIIKFGEDINEIISSLRRVGFSAHSIYHSEETESIKQKHNAIVISW